MVYYQIQDTKIGPMMIQELEGMIISIKCYKEPLGLSENLMKKETPLLHLAFEQIQAYLEGRRKKFTIPIQTHGTDFQERVWEALRQIPYGETRTYGEIAKQVGNPKAARAVGAANHVNPLIIVTPCHRVIGSNHQLVGYAEGIDIKEKLLKMEKENR